MSLSIVILRNILYRADEEIKDANDAIVYYKEEQQRYKKAKDDNNAQIIKLRTEKEDANGSSSVEYISEYYYR
jgi:hypothetical protein